MLISETPRLLFTQFSIEDVDGFYSLNNDPQVIKFTGDRAFHDREEVKQFIQNYDQYRLNGFGRWSLYLKSTGEYIGFCGLRKDINTGEVDIGFRLMRKFWHQGYAFEAARESIRIGFEQYGVNVIVARAMEDNSASHALIDKLGMSYHSRLTEQGVTWIKYQLKACTFESG